MAKLSKRMPLSALWTHARNGDLAGIRKELADGADPNLGDDAGFTPLQASVQGGHPDALTLLLGAGADPNHVDRYGNGALWTAVLSAPLAVRVEIIRILLKAGAEPDRKNHHGRSPRDMAVELGHGLEVPFAGG